MNSKIKRPFFFLLTAICLAVDENIQGQTTYLNDTWQDVAGHFINAHGGCVLFYEGVYYWYGESKAGSTYLPACNKSWGGTRVDVTGVSCYSSTNLINWKNEGIVLHVVNDTNCDLHPSKVLERPKVIYNLTTKKFVMWMHIDSADYSAARSGVAICDTPTREGQDGED